MMLAVSKPKRRLALGLVLAALTLAVSSCGNDEHAPTVVVGAGDAVESRLLAEIYAQALARTGLRTAVKPALGQRGASLAALDAGTVAVVGDHTGELLTFLDETSSARLPDEVTAALNASLPQGLIVADPAKGTDMRARVLYSADAADRDNIETVSDLAARCDDLDVGVAAVPGVLAPSGATRVSGCASAQQQPFPNAAAMRLALTSGDIQAGILSGPPMRTPEAAAGFTVLPDEAYAVRAQNVIPVLRKGVLDEQQLLKLNYVAGELTTEELVDMIAQLEQGAAAADVARGWLDAHAL